MKRNLIWFCGFIILISGAIACDSQTPSYIPEKLSSSPSTKYSVYQSSIYGYEVNYPQTWAIDIDEDDMVSIRPIQSMFFADAFIIVHPKGNGFRPIQDIASGYIKRCKGVYKDYSVEYSQAEEAGGNWDWLITANYVPKSQNYPFRESCYFKLTSNMLYEFHVDIDYLVYSDNTNNTQNKTVQSKDYINYINETQHMLDSFHLTNQDKKKTEVWQTYTNPTIGYSIQYPPGWAIYIDRQDTDATIVAISDENSSTEILACTSSTITKQYKTLEDYVEACKQRGKQLLNNRDISQNTMLHQGNKAIITESIWQAPGADTKQAYHKDMYIFYNDISYTVGCNTDDFNNYQRYSDVFERILSSFSLLK